ncbi:glycosyltransferase [Microbacterium pygmaeum]|uniref:D-inositol 3-phosphate glycosyltransferase n=1 Tax=Microbacterium pygmaeum TaxID=370764 RepID=A0A1G7WGR0_9MICO|nr:glycosyltransferase [Microbacterium pygmaeum]SDG71088.1 Glycosyltransferase involved in cell wall bisynthesis [Microbacterium pygmaeum]
MGVQTALDAVREAPGIVEAIRLADDLAFEAGRDPGVRTLRVLSTALKGEDQVAAIAAVHALAEVFDDQAARMLTSLLSDDRATIREHAAWALGSGLPRIDAVGRLIGQVVSGGFTGMLAQRTLEKWSTAAADILAVSLETALQATTDPGGRARLVETVGLVRPDVATRVLREVARDGHEGEDARVAAVAALGQRPGAPGVREILEEALDGAPRIAGAARLALIDLDAARDAPVPVRAEGLTIGQLFLHADIDPSLSAVGAGDNGGIATLLVRLGDALVADPSTGVGRVITLSRGPVSQAAEDLLEIGSIPSGHIYGRVPLLPAPVPSAAAWPLRVTARRGIRRILRSAGRVDLLHLRMADVGSLAAADVARELGIPTVFTVAPDPHAVIRSLDRSGALTRGNFGATDLREHFWFRARLVTNLAANAAHTVLFPRPALQQDMRQLVGIDITSHPERHTVVAEGVDLAVVDGAVSTAREPAPDRAPAGVEELRALLTRLPEHRRSLPLVLTVGRMHRVKGMATLVEAWACGPLRDRANLLIVGGDLEHPSLDEREQLTRIDAAVPPGERDRAGLILAGHRPNDVAAQWLAAARFGLPALMPAGGVYVCASVKEEFGIALLEAMATGLMVVAPDGGGPATYVEDGVTGILTQTWDVARLASAVGAALDVAVRPDEMRADAAHEMVRANFTIQAMASALGPIYRGVAADEEELIRAGGAVL